MRARKLLMVGTLLAALALPVAAAVAGSAGPRVNVNTATVEELASLPGIGPAKARAIVARRQQQPFATVDDLRKVRGIGDRLLEQLRDRVTVGSQPAPEHTPMAPRRARGS